MKQKVNLLWQTVCGNMVTLKRGDDHVLRRALQYEVGGQRKKERLKRKYKRQVQEEREVEKEV